MMDIAALAYEIRRDTLVHSRRANVGHIGSSLSVADILAALYGGVIRLDGGSDRDRFVLSKGHAALALYATLQAIGSLSRDSLLQFCGDGTALGTHPERGVRGIDFATGSLGHGLSYGVGAALAARMSGSKRRAFVLMSDAELNEGSVWEAAMFAAHARLSRLVAIVDVNGQQAFGHTRDVIDLSPLDERWRGFGWEVRCVDGHDLDGLVDALGTSAGEGRPVIVLASTTFGSGVSFMEREIAWHYLPLSESEFEQALREVEERYAC